MLICDICGGKADSLTKKIELPIKFENNCLTFKELDCCYGCQIGLREAANLAKLKYIEKRRKEQWEQ